MDSASILVIDDEQDMRELLAFELSQEGFQTATAESGTAAAEILRQRKFDLALTDLMMPGIDGIDTIEALKSVDPDIEVIIATGYATVETAIAAMKKGAYDYIRKPFDLAELRLLLQRALEKRTLAGAVSLYEASQAFLGTLGHAELVQRVLDSSAKVLRTAAAALAFDEPSGKAGECFCSAPEVEALARALAGRASGSSVLQVGPAVGNGGGEALHGSRYGSALAYPLIVRDNRLGALVLLRAKDQPGFSPSERERGMILAGQVALALENARLYSTIESMAITDELTGLFSRRFLLESMRKQTRLLSRPGSGKITCLMIDLDHFKRVNDGLGHLEGDRVLREVGRAIRGSIRDSDIAARFGGDEFVVLLPATDEAGGARVAEKLQAAVSRAIESPSGLTLSVGIASCEIEAQDWTKVRGDPRRQGTLDLTTLLLNRADAALYRAKEAGRNRFHIWQASDAA